MRKLEELGIFASSSNQLENSMECNECNECIEECECDCYECLPECIGF